MDEETLEKLYQCFNQNDPKRDFDENSSCERLYLRAFEKSCSSENIMLPIYKTKSNLRVQKKMQSYIDQLEEETRNSILCSDKTNPEDNLENVETDFSSANASSSQRDATNCSSTEYCNRYLKVCTSSCKRFNEETFLRSGTNVNIMSSLKRRDEDNVGNVKSDISINLAQTQAVSELNQNTDVGISSNNLVKHDDFIQTDNLRNNNNNTETSSYTDFVNVVDNYIQFPDTRPKKMQTICKNKISDVCLDVCKDLPRCDNKNLDKIGNAINSRNKIETEEVYENVKTDGSVESNLKYDQSSDAVEKQAQSLYELKNEDIESRISNNFKTSRNSINESNTTQSKGSLQHPAVSQVEYLKKTESRMTQHLCNNINFEIIGYTKLVECVNKCFQCSSNSAEEEVPKFHINIDVKSSANYKCIQCPNRTISRMQTDNCEKKYSNIGTFVDLEKIKKNSKKSSLTEKIT